MPDPKNYTKDERKKFFKECIQQLKSEGKSSQDARKQCSAMWYETHED